MNIELRRYGIVIKSIPVTGDKASIGSGAGCDILIEDPYLSAHVGDLVRRGETWYITDAGTSLDGITRDGERIEDEPIAEGKVYTISGFELVAQLQQGARRPPDARPATAGAAVPGTIVESIEGLRRGSNVIPGTVVEPIADLRRKPQEIPRTVFEPMPVRPAPAASAAVPVPSPVPAPPASAPPRRRILLLAVFVLGLLLLLLLVVARGRRKPKEELAKPEVAATQSAPAAPPPAPAPVVVSADELLRSLEYDRALNAWERQLAGADDAAIRARYAELALEIGRIRAASQAADARGYFERAVKWGPAAGSEAVAEAKRRLGN